MPKPKVSVVIPMYNASRFICETIQSVLNQSYTDYEIIVVDDGSTDNSLASLDKYRGQIRILTKTNGGPASARNEGINAAGGEFIAFLDADDIWLPNKLAVQVEYMGGHPDIGFSYAQVRCFSTSQSGMKIPRRELICDLEGSVFRDLFWSITPERYNELEKKWRATQDDYRSKLDKLHLADKEYYITCSYLLEVASRSYELFKGSTPEEKREIIGLTLSNLFLDNGKLEYTLQSPFDSIFVACKGLTWGG